jgi:hypothetical protein
MNYLDILYNLLTSSVVVGIGTYIIHKRIDTRFKKIEEFQKTLINIRKERYDTLLKTLQEIWEKLIETEFYIRWDIGEQVTKAGQKNQKHIDIDSTPLKSAWIFIEKRSILLNDELSNMTRNLFEKHLLKTYNGYIDILKEVSSNKKTMDDLKDFLLNSLGQQYKTDSDVLRKEFEKQSREILYDKV